MTPVTVLQLSWVHSRTRTSAGSARIPRNDRHQIQIATDEQSHDSSAALQPPAQPGLPVPSAASRPGPGCVEKPVLLPLLTCARLPGRGAQAAPVTTRHVVAPPIVSSTMCPHPGQSRFHPDSSASATTPASSSLEQLTDTSLLQCPQVSESHSGHTRGSATVVPLPTNVEHDGRQSTF